MRRKRKIKKIPDEDDYEALDRVARNITLDMLKPMGPRDRLLWEAFKRNQRKKKRRGKDTSKL